jgi:ABC-2 type transport system permease protein
LVAVAVGIGTITGVQNAVVGEKQLGTAAWILSKPASRSAFLLSKLLSYTIGFWAAGIIVPAIVFYVETRLIFPASVQILPFLLSVSVLELNQLFYLALTLMLGTLFESRGTIAGIGIGFLVGGFILTKMIPPEPLVITPWLLPDISAALALSQPLPSFWLIPILAAGVWIIVMMAVALIHFQREEF